MKTSEAVALIREAIPRTAGTWADLGAGTGTFTRALIGLTGPESRIYAVDRDARALAALREVAASKRNAEVVPVVADFTQRFELPGLGADDKLDGILLANALHFVRDQEAVLRSLVTLLEPHGRVVIVEYDGRGPDRWVPFPIPSATFPALATAVGLSNPRVVGTLPSRFGGSIYAGVAEWGGR